MKYSIKRIASAVSAALLCGSVVASTFSLEATSCSFNKDGGSGRLVINFTGGLSWQTPSVSSSWIHLSGFTSSSSGGNGTVVQSYTVDANSGSARTGTISGKFNGESYTYTIQQAGATAGNSYIIKFNKNDGRGATSVETFKYGTKTRLPLLKSGLGWARSGYKFKGWATSPINAYAGKIWKADWAYVSTPIAAGNTLNVYAVWEPANYAYTIRFNKNDGSGVTKSVKFRYGDKTRLPALKNGLGWSRSGYTFGGWATSAANASKKIVWKPDWAYVQTPTGIGNTLTVYAIWK